MTVKELKEKLSLLNDNANIIFNCEDINGTEINSDFNIQANDGDDNSPVFFEFSLDDSVCPPNIKSTYKNKYFDEIGYKNSTSETCVFGMNNDHRMPMWNSVQSETGMWDERVSWNLDTFMLEQIYTWLKIYFTHADEFVDLNFYKFDISFNNGKTIENKTEREWILQTIDLIKEYLLSVDSFDVEKEHYGQECAKKAFIILGEILPTLWW